MPTQLKDGYFSAWHLPENRADPHRILAELRRTDPVHYDPARQCWMLTRYRDVVSVLHHGQFVSSRPMQPARTTSARAMSLHSILAQQMLFLDGEEHLRLRQVLLKPLALMSTSLHASIEGVVENLLTDMQVQASVDIVSDFAVLPLKVISRILGVPREDERRLGTWTDALANVTSGYLAGGGLQQIMPMMSYVRELVEQKRVSPGDDLLSAFTLGLQQGQFRSSDELAVTAMMLMAAGSVTTARLLTHGLSVLLQDRTRIDLLRERIQAKPEVVKGVVEELLRSVTPTRFVARWAVRDVAIGGNVIRAGQKVVVFLEAANHDPERFTAPEELDFRRLPNPHVAFGGGPHLCPGAALARVEAQIAFAALLRRFPHLHLASGGAPALHPNVNLGGFLSLPVVLG